MARDAVSTTQPLFDPAAYPPFPDDIPTVELETYSLARLEAGDEAHQQALLETCKARGFFYLDLGGSSAQNMQDDADSLARLAGEVHQLPVQEQEKYPMKGGLFGFKKAGSSRTDAAGTPDTATFFNISKDAILNPNAASNQQPALPQPIIDQQPLVARYMRTAHATGLSLVSLIMARLGQPADVLAPYHRIGAASGDHVRMTYGPPRRTSEQPEIQTPGHTDFGTITILFNWLGGLQVWSDPARGDFRNVVDPDSASAAPDGRRPVWLWVKPPPPNHAIVNLGDAAVKWTGGVLCSGRHRVVPAPGDQGKFHRFSIVYFVRPEDEAVLKRLKGPGIPELAPNEQEQEDADGGVTAKEWILRQARGLGLSIAD
ncbi:hypothetical protein BD289DRAFT_483878 [Coniella lustricola]|uniref:Fe2OG dioxygenase domain-containing protein n=1 Tax=Coniella lustricola TaxID=2025994 RepID=A0A2T3A444_9PEZI|nr:hypothetical protein BD289DRAFT_483878 [Coniella lustricola]